MRPQRIQAIDRIVRQGAIGLADALSWFYVEVAGLEVFTLDGDENAESAGRPGEFCEPTRGRSDWTTLVTALHFRSRQQYLRIDLLANPIIDSGGFPVVISVPSLEEAAELLEGQSMAYETISGLSWPDRRLSTLDPAGNRVELKRDWPYNPL